MMLAAALQALLLLHAGASSVPAPEDEPAVQTERQAVSETSDIEAKGDVADAPPTKGDDDGRESSDRNDGRGESFTREEDRDDSGKGSPVGTPAPSSSEIEPK